MKHLLLSILFCSLSISAYGQMITDGANKGLTVDQVIGYRMEGMARLVKASQIDATEAKADLAATQRAIDYWKIDDAKAWAWGTKNEQAVKALAMLLSIIIVLWLGPMIAGQILKNLPTVEAWVATVAAICLLFLGSYYGSITGIYAISRWVPTIPVWHDIAAHFRHIPKIQ